MSYEKLCIMIIGLCDALYNDNIEENEEGAITLSTEIDDDHKIEIEIKKEVINNGE